MKKKERKNRLSGIWSVMEKPVLLLLPGICKLLALIVKLVVQRQEQ